MLKILNKKWTKSNTPADSNHFYSLLPLSKSLCADVCSVCVHVVEQGVGVRDEFSGLFDLRRILFWPVYVAPQASCETGG